MAAAVVGPRVGGLLRVAVSRRGAQSYSLKLLGTFRDIFVWFIFHRLHCCCLPSIYAVSARHIACDLCFPRAAPLFTPRAASRSLLLLMMTVVVVVAVVYIVVACFYCCGCWLLVVGCWLLVVGCWLLVVGCWLLSVVGCRLSAVGCCCGRGLHQSIRCHISGFARLRSRMLYYPALGL
jgi:hypothetical protein